MTETPAPNIYEETFAKTDKTDAILMVGDKKLHVNKALLSYHSDYFNTLFNSDFKEKSMEEIPIDDVIFEDFATLLSLVHEKPIKFEESNAEKLLELAERFLLPSVKRHVELFLIQTLIDRVEKIRIADKFQLDELMKHALLLFTMIGHFQKEKKYMRGTSSYYQMLKNETFDSFADETQLKLFERSLEVAFKNGKKSCELVKVDFEKMFAETDKTDAILIVQGKKLNVNKALLSYHSDYFKTLFNSDSKEKSMEEIPIDDVIFEDFAAFLSLVQDNPIMPTESNAEKLLELADRLFLLPSVKRHVELFLLSTKFDRMEKIRIGDKYQLEDLVTKGIELFAKTDDFKDLQESKNFQDFSAKTKIKLFDKFLID